MDEMGIVQQDVSVLKHWNSFEMECPSDPMNGGFVRELVWFVDNEEINCFLSLRFVTAILKES